MRGGKTSRGLASPLFTEEDVYSAELHLLIEKKLLKWAGRQFYIQHGGTNWAICESIFENHFHRMILPASERFWIISIKPFLKSSEKVIF